MKTLSRIFLISAFAFLAFTFANHAFAAVHHVNVAAVEIDGTKFWLPSVIVVKKGDTVKIHAVSKVPGNGSVHGFEIEAFHVMEVADTKGKDFEFVADKAGVFPIRCQLHPAHIGGQIVVLE